MPDYRAPGVFVEEMPVRSRSIEGVGTSTAAFAGMTARGPIDIVPPVLTSFAEFARIHGGTTPLKVAAPMAATNYLAHAAALFFANGGQRLYVARVPGAGAVAATSGTIDTDAADAAHRIAFVARFPGGADFRVTLSETARPTTKGRALGQPAGTLIRLGTSDVVIGAEPYPDAWIAAGDGAPARIVSLTVDVAGPDGAIQRWTGLGYHPRHPRYVGHMLAQEPPDTADRLTNPVAIEIGKAVDASALRAALLRGAVPSGRGTAPRRTIDLHGGIDATGPPTSSAWDAALARLLALEDVSIVAAPGASALPGDQPAAMNRKLIEHAHTPRSYRIAVLDPPPNLSLGDIRTLRSSLESSRAALYYPWIRCANAIAGGPATIALPPSGAICGIYARTDSQRGVFKSPANEIVIGAVGLQRTVAPAEERLVGPLGINCIRTFPARGIRVWGARTVSSDHEWKYVSLRRYFLYLEASIDRGTQWAVFEPNRERLWQAVSAAIGDFLLAEWRRGALIGASPARPFSCAATGPP